MMLNIHKCLSHTPVSFISKKGFMNMSADASWVASLVSMTEENTLAGPHCQWSLSPEDASGTSFLEGTTRVHKVQQLLKTLIML